LSFEVEVYTTTKTELEDNTGIYYTDPAIRPILQAELAKLEAQIGKKVVVELLPLKNFFDAMDLVRDKYNFKVKPEIKDRLDKGDADLNFDLFVIDCPVALDQVTETAISFADTQDNNNLF